MAGMGGILFGVPESMAGKFLFLILAVMLVISVWNLLRFHRGEEVLIGKQMFPATARRITLIGCFAIAAAFSIGYGDQKQPTEWYGPILLTSQEAITKDAIPENCEAVALASFHFDGGFESVFTNALPVLERHEVPASAFIVTDRVGEQAHMERTKLEELAARGWEIGSHTHTHPDDIRELSVDELNEELKKSSELLDRWGFEPAGLSSPRGRFDKTVIDIAQRYYQYHRSLLPDPNPLPLPENPGPGSRWVLYSLPVKHDMPADRAVDHLQLVEERGGWSILRFTHIADEKGRWSYPPERFERIVRAAREELGFCTLTEVREGKCRPRAQRE